MFQYMLLTTFITNEALGKSNYYKLNEQSTYSRLDQFLSSLHSMKKIGLNAADFYIDFDKANLKYRELVENYIRQNFAQTDCRIFSYRLENFHQWKAAAKNIPAQTNLILLNSNHDHAFIPQETSEYLDFFRFLESREPTAIGNITHWPEHISGYGLKKFITLQNKESTFIKERGFLEGTVLVKNDFFKSWWENDFTGGKRIVRPDNPFGPWIRFGWVKQYIPSTEFFRHMDGYGHVGIKSPQSSSLKPCCQVINGRILHRDWIRGFRNSKSADLPIDILPSITYSQSTSRLFEAKDYLINVNSFQFSIIRTIQLIKPKKIKHLLEILLFMLSILRYSYIRSALYRKLKFICSRNYVMCVLKKILIKCFKVDISKIVPHPSSTEVFGTSGGEIRNLKMKNLLETIRQKYI